VTLNIQFFTLFMMFCSGLALGVLFDVCRVVSGKLGLPRYLFPLVDIVYWIVATILVFYMLMVSNEGQVRVFVFLGIGIGICFYFALLSHWIIWMLLILIRVLIGLYRFTKKMGHLFLIRPILGIYRLLVILFGFLIALTVFLYKIVLQLLYPLWRLLLWMIRPLRKLRLWPAGMARIPKKVLEFFGKLFWK
jgi:spore cortex biosynthesis protein YabQ